MYSMAKVSMTSGSRPVISAVYSSVYFDTSSTRWSKAVRQGSPSTSKVPESAPLTPSVALGTALPAVSSHTIQAASSPSPSRSIAPSDSRTRKGATELATSQSLAWRSLEMMTFIMPRARAGSVWALMGIHWSAMAAVEHRRGSTTTILAPFSRAFTR